MARHKEAPSEPSPESTPGTAAQDQEEAAEPFVEPQVDLTTQVENDLTPLDAIQRYARSTWDVQRLAYIRGIAVAAAVAGWRSSRNLLPLLRELVSLPDLAVRQALASQLTPMAKSWAEDGGEAGYTDAMELLDLGLHLIGDESEEVAQAGRDAVLGMAAILVPADVPRLLAALDELACFPDEDVRQSVVIMLAGLTGLLSETSCTEMLLPRVMRLLEDNAYLVRKECATALAEMASSVSADACETMCVRGIVTLSKDRVWAVRVAAAAAIPAIAAGADPQTRAGVLRQRLEALVTDVSKWVRPVARHSLGPFLATLRAEDVSDELVSHFVETASARGEDATALQIACAAHFPEVTAVAGAARWERLQPALATLASAGEAATRAALAGNLHRLAEALPEEEHGAKLLEPTEKLLNDAEPAVQQAVARNCVDLLSALPAEARLGLFGQIRAVVAESKCAWRIRLALADQLGSIALLFDIEAVAAEVVPAAIELCRDPVAVVRVAAADQMGQLLASEQEGARPRAELLAKALRVLSRDPVFQMRQVYIYMCYRLIGLVEPEFFQQQFIGPLLSLESDPIANVRMALARMLAAADLTNLPNAVEVLKRMSRDPDRDTAEYAAAAEIVAHTPSRQLLEQAAGSNSPTRQHSIGTPRPLLRRNSLDEGGLSKRMLELPPLGAGDMPELPPSAGLSHAELPPPRSSKTAISQAAIAAVVPWHGQHGKDATAASSPKAVGRTAATNHAQERAQPSSSATAPECAEKAEKQAAPEPAQPVSSDSAQPTAQRESLTDSSQQLITEPSAQGPS